LGTITEAAALSERLNVHLAKAKRLTHRLLATLIFFFMIVTTRVQALNLAPAIEQPMLDVLILALYLERVAARRTRGRGSQRILVLLPARPSPSKPEPAGAAGPPQLSSATAGGTTAGKSLFGQPQASLLAQVLQRMPWPARTVRQRPRPSKPPYLVPVAA
jgi:hypothetical protein